MSQRRGPHPRTGLRARQGKHRGPSGYESRLEALASKRCRHEPGRSGALPGCDRGPNWPRQTLAQVGESERQRGNAVLIEGSLELGDLRQIVQVGSGPVVARSDVQVVATSDAKSVAIAERKGFIASS